MADTDIIDINEDVPTTIDFTKPVELREREKTFVFDTPRISKDIIAGSDSNEDDKRRLIMLHIASKLNKDPNTMDYKAAVGSYIGKFAQDAPISQTFERLQGKLSPEIDDNYTSLQEFTGMSEEEQIKLAAPLSESKALGMDMSMMMSSVSSEEVEDMKSSALDNQINAMSSDEKRQAIIKYQRDLLNKSPRAIIEHGEKSLSDKARRMADKMSFGHDPGLPAFNDLSQSDQASIFQYVRAINPKVDSSSWDYLSTRFSQSAKDAAESLKKSGQRLMQMPESNLALYEKLSTNMDKAAVSHFADTGEWPDKESQARADELVNEIVERSAEYRAASFDFAAIEMMGFGGQDKAAIARKQAAAREKVSARIKKDLSNKIHKGRESVNQRKFDKAVKGATRKLFKVGIAEKVLVEGTVVIADMAVALGLGIGTGGAGTLTYSYGRVFGDFAETLIDDHNVDPDEARTIAGIGSLVYSAIEKLQVGHAADALLKTATKTQKTFAKSFKDKLPEFIKKISNSNNPIIAGLVKTTSTLTLETAEESGQAFTEQFMKAYAKWYADAEGVEYEDLVGDWYDQTIDAITGMGLISILAGGRRAKQKFSGNFDNLTMKKNINDNPAGLDLDIAAKDFDELSPAIQQDLHEAVSVDDITEILEENNIKMTAMDYLRVQDIGAAVESDVEVQREELQKDIATKSESVDIDYIDVNRDIERMSLKADAKQFVAPMAEHVDLVEDAPGKFTIKSKTNNNSIQLEFAPVGSGESGRYQGGKITLPENARDFTFNHEMFHGVFDMGVITNDEQSTLIKSAVRRIDTDAIDQRYKEKYASLVDGGDFTAAIRDEEFMAHLVETAVKDPNFTKGFTPEERTIWQKVIEFFKSLYSKKIRAEAKARKNGEAKAIDSSREEAKANLILQDILSGKMLTRDVPGQKAVDIDAFYESEYGADIDAEVKRMQSLEEPDAAAAERMQEDIDRDEALLETALKTPPIANEVKIILDGRKFRFDEKMEREVENLSPAEKARLTKYRTTDKDASNSDVVLDELVQARVLGENATVTEMIEQLARPATAKFSLGTDPDSDLAAMALAGHQFEKGKALTEAQINKALDGYGVTDETARLETIRRADKILNELNESKADLKDHRGITQALAAANLNIEYREGLDRIEKESFKGGKTYQKAIDQLKVREKAARLKDTQDLDDDTIAYLITQYHENITKEESDIDIARLLPSIDKAIRENMIKNELITAKNKKGYKSMPEYRATLAKTLEAISMNLIRQITPGRRKTALYADSRKLKTLTTTKAIENNFNKLIAKIHESRIVEDKATLLKRFNKLFKSAAIKEREKSTQELIHSKVKKDEDGNIIAMAVHPMIRRELNLIKQIAKLSKVEADKIRDDMLKFYNDPSDLEGQDTATLFKDLEERFSAFKKYKHLEPVDRAAIMMGIAAEYGGIKEKTATELSDSIDSITEMIEGSKKNLEDLINKKNDRVNPMRKAVANTKGKRRSEFGQKTDRFIASSFGMRSWFKDIIRQASTEDAKEAQKHLDVLIENWNRGIHARDVAKMHDHEKFGESIQDIYNTKDAWAVEKDLNTKKKEYSHLSKHGDNMSKFQVMQLYASAVQQDYLKNAEKNDRQAGKYAAVLTPQDMKMIQWFRDYYANERTALSAQMVKMTGIPIEMLDPFYVPVKVESNLAGLGTEINATSIIPPGMTTRVNHNLDFDESVGIFEIWARKVEENNHFKYMADAAVDMRSVFSQKPVHEAIEHNFGKSYKNAFLTMIKDNINDGGPSTYDVKLLDKVRGTWTALKFTLNARIGIKQLTSIPAFGLEIGLMDTAKYLSNFMSTDGREAMSELWNSDLRKERWGSGNTEAVQNAIGGISSHTTASKWFRRAGIFNSLGDMGPVLVIGQGIYRSYTATYFEQGATMEEAKARAISKTFEIVESTQQSPKMKDMSEWQRRGGSLGKMAAQFTNTTRQFLEKDFTNIRPYIQEAISTGKLINPKLNSAANTFFINHILLPGAYNGMNMLINTLMGDDIDEDDWWLMFSSMVSGPFSGFIVFGSMLNGAIETAITRKAPWGGKSLTPFAGIKDDINNAVLATEGALTTDWDQFDKAFTKLMKSLFAPYREVTKYNKNND